MIVFPNIDYPFWLEEWNKNLQNPTYHLGEMDKYSKIPKGITEYECEKQIYSLIQNISDPSIEKEKVLMVIDLIYRWGGPSGRMFYIGTNKSRKSLNDDLYIFERYCDAINLAFQGKSSSKFLFQSIPGIGSSFASKHATFWSSKSTKPLIVVDSKIAGCFGMKNLDELDKAVSYEKILFEFKVKADKLNGFNSQYLEKALFTFHKNYFNNENDGWNPKQTGIIKDKLEAERLAQILGLQTNE
jgi:hypothetical protein